MEKRIKKMEQDLIDSVEHETLFDVDFYTTSKNLINKGYRKEIDILCEINDIIQGLKVEIETAHESLISQDLKTPCLVVLMLLQTKMLEKYKEKGYE